ncbi:hypothetical protein GCM10010238_29550 [Streptomyces griseoviridis]|uniref:Uncharacterized protein n=1 Tax=Streptomyces griseoviridis TaxID=45398 RepID=A0A918GJ14_STRGD|nr:hypothetical protein GCM10010238_29550 [Streptomyces niveoruber]
MTGFDSVLRGPDRRPVKKECPFRRNGSATGGRLTGFPCAAGDLGVPPSTDIPSPEKLSTGCAKVLWTPESIIPIRASGMNESRPKPAPGSLSSGNGSLRRMAGKKQVDER